MIWTILIFVNYLSYLIVCSEVIYPFLHSFNIHIIHIDQLIDKSHCVQYDVALKTHPALKILFTDQFLSFLLPSLLPSLFLFFHLSFFPSRKVCS